MAEAFEIGVAAADGDVHHGGHGAVGFDRLAVDPVGVPADHAGFERIDGVDIDEQDHIEFALIAAFDDVVLFHHVRVVVGEADVFGADGFIEPVVVPPAVPAVFKELPDGDGVEGIGFAGFEFEFAGMARELVHGFPADDFAVYEAVRGMADIVDEFVDGGADFVGHGDQIGCAAAVVEEGIMFDDEKFERVVVHVWVS